MSLAAAVRHLEQGDWQKAHALVQDDDSPLAAWLHGIVHLQEGDRENARYWYAQAGRRLPSPPDIAAEVRAAAEAIDS